MPHLFQLTIPRMLAGILIGVVLLFCLSIVSTFNELSGDPIGNFFDRSDYEKDVQYLFQLAERIGYAKENQLNFYRYQSSTSGVDNIMLIFSSSDSIESFSQKIEQLELSPDKSLASLYGKKYPDTQYLSFINGPDSRPIVLQDSISELSDSLLPTDVAPVVTHWSFLISPDNSSKQRLIVHFAQLTKKGVSWKDRRTGKFINMPIVVMFLSR